jgi:hypothetical protein
MARVGDHEIDEQGNLVPTGGAENGAGPDTDAVEERPVSAADRRRFLRVLAISDVLGVLVLAGSGLLLPESRTLLLILAAVYAIVAVPIYLWMSRQTQRKVEGSERRQAFS